MTGSGRHKANNRQIRQMDRGRTCCRAGNDQIKNTACPRYPSPLDISVAWEFALAFLRCEVLHSFFNFFFYFCELDILHIMHEGFF